LDRTKNEERRTALIAQIRTAFASVTRLGGVSLHEADVIDGYGSPQQRNAARKLDTDRVWWEVPDADIERYYWILPLLDATGFRYYIPAYMTRALAHYEHSESVSDDMTIYALDCGEGRNDQRLHYFKLFSREQSEAVCAFLRFMEDDPAGMADSGAAFGALKRYWGQFCAAESSSGYL
jgi:outer membrane protein assembly factor BamB